MHGLFGEIQISQEAHERRKNPARFQSVKRLNGPAELFGHRRRHLRQTSKRSGSTQLPRGGRSDLSADRTLDSEEFSGQLADAFFIRAAAADAMTEQDLALNFFKASVEIDDAEMQERL